MAKLIYRPDMNFEAGIELLGGKANNLNFLCRHNFNVPQWFAITAKTFRNILSKKSADEDVINYIKDLEMPFDLDFELHKTIDYLGLKGKMFAVRSSALGEDSSSHSFAGQLESFLYIQEKDLFTYIKKVWLSVFDKRVQAYCSENKIDLNSLNVAVIIQEMIDSDVSGVAFTLDPVTGNRDSVVISSVYGLGEGLVSGLLDSDNFTVSGDSINAKIVTKNQAIKPDLSKNQNTITEKVDPELQNKPSLKDAQILEIASISKQIAELYSKPQDIEWTIAGNVLYILQSRPVTTLDKVPDKTAFKTVWDNSNIIESYSGITLPLTFSFISVVYTEVYKQFCRIMGVEENLIEKNDHIFSMIGLIKGRVYYNLLNWYNLLSLLPGYSINAEFMEQMMGVKEKLDLPLTAIQSAKNKYWRLFTLALNLIINLITLPVEINKFYNYLNSILKPYEQINLDNENIDKLMGHYLHIESSLIKKWHAPLVNDFFAMIFYGVLKNIISKWGIDQNNTLQNDLMIGQGDIISTQPIKNIRNIANKICLNEELQELFTKKTDAEILTRLDKYPEINSEIQKHIDIFGNRCINELKLETITYKHDPGMLISTISSYVKMGFVDLQELKQREITLKQNAESTVNKALGNNIIKKMLFNYIMNQARQRVKDRENLRFERTRVFAQIREIFLATGKKLYSEGIIDDCRDIFYLTKEEIFAFITGTAVSSNLKDLIELRKKEYCEYKKLKLTDRFETYGMVYHANTFQRPEKEFIDGEALSGIGCSPGIVKAKVKIVIDPESAEGLEGCIMVAERTDPGWVPLFPIAKALLVERGSVLSHSAIVAREMGIPAIVGITGLLDQLSDGDLVEMDGSTGIVNKIN